MASKKTSAPPKPITREELEGMGHKDLAKVKTKRRIAASLPTAADVEAESKPEKPKTKENLSPRERMERGHAKADEARATRGGQKGADDGGD
jgi:hypothetical protein